jgi:uncharacterized protein (DUF2267 family)
VLATLGERLSPKERNDIASQLPKELKDAIFAELPPNSFHSGVANFSIEEFYTGSALEQESAILPQKRVHNQ